MNNKIIAFVFLAAVLRPCCAQSTAGGANRTAPSPAPVAAPVNPIAVNPLTGLAAVSAINYQPLTGKERWQLYWSQNYWSMGAYVGPVFSALVLDQASGSPQEWGGGFEGFGKRAGSHILASIIQGNVQAGLAAPLREDVRYISAGRGGFTHRVLHAIAFSFLTYTNHGRTTLNIANLTGYYAATAITTEWVPIHESTGKYILTRGSEQIGLAIPVNILQEFWPDIRRKFSHRP
jgi:hypothetical protein